MSFLVCRVVESPNLLENTPPPSSPMPRCLYCGRPFPTTKSLHSHQAQDLVCQQKRAEDQERLFHHLSRKQNLNPVHPSPSNPTNLPSETLPHDPMQIDINLEATASTQELTQNQPKPAQKCSTYWVPLLSHLRAGESKGRAETSFERIRQRQQQQGQGAYGQFQTAEDWDLAKWLTKNVGQNATDSFLKLPIVSTCSTGGVRTRVTHNQ